MAAALRPSAAPIWGNCSASVLASKDVPNLESANTLEGSAAHWVASEVLVGCRDFKLPATTDRFIGKQAPNGVIIDEDMAEGAQVFVDDSIRYIGKHLKNANIESTLPPAIHPENYGTPDLWAYWPEARLILVSDYKHGHRERSAEGDLQLINYVYGVVNEMHLDAEDPATVRVCLRIVQPFCYRNGGPVSVWEGTLADLMPYKQQLQQKAFEAFNGPLMSTGKHCRDCPAVWTCTARRRANYNFIDMVNQPYEMDAMQIADLATQRRILADGIKTATAQLEAIEDNLTHRISSGEIGSGLVLQSSFGREAWKIPPEQAEALASQFGFSITKPAVLTPAQARKKAPKALRSQFEQAVETMTGRPSNGAKLVKAGDSRTAKAFKIKEG